MKNIKSFTITKLGIRGFTTFKDYKEFIFNHSSFIFGANGQGKTTIADAIAFVFTGRTFYDESADELLNKESDEMSVILELTDNDSEHHELLRSRKNNKTIILFDKRKMLQKDIDSIFCEKNMFLSMLNPTHLVDKLKIDGREILERYLPLVAHEKVLKKLSEEENELLIDETLLSPIDFINYRKEEVKALEKELQQNTAQKDLVEQQKEDIQKDIESKKLELENNQKLKEELYNSGFVGRDKEKDELLVGQLENEIKELENKAKVDNSTKLQDLKVRQGALLSQITSLKKEEFVTENSGEIIEMSRKLDQLYKLYYQLDNLIQSVKPGWKCPTCYSGVSDDNISKVRQILEEQQNECKKAGAKAKIILTEEEHIAKHNREQYKRGFEESLNKLQYALADVESQILEIETFEQNKEGILKEKHEELGEALWVQTYGNLDIKQKVTYGQYIQSEYKLAGEIEDLNKRLNDLNEYAFSSTIEDLKAEIQGKELLINAVKNYVSEKYKILFCQVRLNRVGFKLYEVVKSTGEIKSVFKFTYNGRSFSRLSYSESILARLEISELLKKLSGYNYPVFIDNMESIEKIDNVVPTGQIFMAYVKKCLPLTIQPFSPKLEKESGGEINAA